MAIEKDISEIEKTIENLRFKRDELGMAIRDEDVNITKIITGMLIKEGVKFHYSLDTGYVDINIYPYDTDLKCYGRSYKDSRNIFEAIGNFFTAPFVIGKRANYSKVNISMRAKHGGPEIEINNFDYLNTRNYRKLKRAVDKMDRIGKRNLQRWLD